MSFDKDFVDQVDKAREIDIETGRRGRKTIIWIVVDGGQVYVRSVRGDGGKWYQRLKASPEGALHLGGKRVEFRAVPVTDADEIERVSEALRRKYRTSKSSLAMMLEPKTLPTTLRLE